MLNQISLKHCKKGLHQYPADKKQCPICQKLAKRRWQQANPDSVRASCAKWREQNVKKYQKLNRNWYKNNLEKHKDNCRKWRCNNLDVKNALEAKRRAIKKRAMPSWANVEKIQSFYAEAKRLTEETGIKHEVDHIYPLQSQYLCGLHVETNLQVLPASENRTKKNRKWPGQLDCQK